MLNATALVDNVCYDYNIMDDDQNDGHSEYLIQDFNEAKNTTSILIATTVATTI